MRCWLLVAVTAAAGCQYDCHIDTPCAVDGGGEYYILEPKKPTGMAFMFLHGAQLDNVEVLEKVDEDLFLDAGIRLVMADSDDGRWSVSDGREAGEEEAAFLARIADTLRDDGLADAGLALGGHSVGSSMAWFAACYEPDAFDAVNATSGGFWEPAPESCEGPMALRHTHGTADPMVPLEGRVLREGVVQSDILEGMEVWAETNHCDAEPEQRSDPGHECTVYTGCDEPLEICLHDDGHKLLPDWERRAIDWITAAM